MLTTVVPIRALDTWRCDGTVTPCSCLFFLWYWIYSIQTWWTSCWKGRKLCKSYTSKFSVSWLCLGIVRDVLFSHIIKLNSRTEEILNKSTRKRLLNWCWYFRNCQFDVRTEHPILLLLALGAVLKRANDVHHPPHPSRWRWLHFVYPEPLNAPIVAWHPDSINTYMVYLNNQTMLYMSP